MRQLPNESIIYFGDTARVPYGPKSPDTVRRYSREITRFLRDQGVKAIVVACNTATAHALPTLRDEYDLPVIGVVEPGARAAVAATRPGHIGVIGTRGNDQSRRVRARHQPRRRQARRSRRAHVRCSFRSSRKAGSNTEATRAHRATNTSRRFVSAEIDTLVLGCTHYPLLKPLIGEVVGREVRLIDSAEETARETARDAPQRIRSRTTMAANTRAIASSLPMRPSSSYARPALSRVMRSSALRQ